MFREKHKAAGFTVIELIIVIVIISILAGVVIPRFINQTSSARLGMLNGLAGSLNATIMLAQAEYIAEGNGPTSSATSITMNGTAVTVIAGTGYPAGTAGGIGVALTSNTGFTPAYVAGVVTYIFRNNPPASNCNVIYNAAAGAVSVSPSGC